MARHLLEELTRLRCVSDAIPQHSAAQNPASLTLMHHGLCLVGGSASGAQDNGAMDGCYNCGPNPGSASTPKPPKRGLVSGSSRKRVRGGWFVTGPHDLPALAAHFNTLAYDLVEARNSWVARANELQDLKKQRADAASVGQPFTRMDAYRRAVRRWESVMKRVSDLAEDLVVCQCLIERCSVALEASPVSASHDSNFLTIRRLSD